MCSRHSGADGTTRACEGREAQLGKPSSDHLTMECEATTLIIGAGPAGLAVAACLRKRGTRFVVVEGAAHIGSSWRRHYARLHLHTDKAHSALPYLDFPAGTPRYPSREHMITYLERYARHFDVTPHLGEEVRSVTAADGGWLTTTRACVYHSPRVVIATGYNAVPHTPVWPGQERFRGRILHSSEYSNGEPFRGLNVLVVGFGNSGGEIAIDLHEHGARVTMSVRGAVNIVPREIIGLPILTVSIALSRLPAAFADLVSAPILRMALGNLPKLGFRKPALGPFAQIKCTSRIPLIDIGTIRLVRDGDIEIRGGISSISETAVIFEDGSLRSFDAMVLATGFRSGLERFLHVSNSVRHSSAKKCRDGAIGEAGLYFCGFYVSATGMLRDIGFDARLIAEHIATTA